MKALEAHNSELAKLREIIPVAAAPRPTTTSDLTRYGYELARLVVMLVDGGQLKSNRRYAMAKDLIAAYEGGAR